MSVRTSANQNMIVVSIRRTVRKLKFLFMFTQDDRCYHSIFIRFSLPDAVLFYGFFVAFTNDIHQRSSLYASIYHKKHTIIIALKMLKIRATKNPVQYNYNTELIFRSIGSWTRYQISVCVLCTVYLCWYNNEKPRMLSCYFTSVRQ